MPRRAIILAMLLLPASLHAQARIEPPVVGRPPHFNGAVGRYTLEVAAEPTTLHVEEPLLLHVRIVGSGPDGQQPMRRGLQVFPDDWDDDFYTEPAPDEDRADPVAGAWEFVFRLRPKRERVRAIAGLSFVYYDPALRKYQTALQDDDIPLTVTPRPALREDWDVRSLDVPASFFVLVPTAFSIPLAGVPWYAWLVAAVALPPLLCWFISRLRPTPRPHTAVAAEARAQLAAHAAAPWLIVRLYLDERFRYRAEELTPADAIRCLRMHGVSRLTQVQMLEFLAACDAARFAPSTPVPCEPLYDLASSLVSALETERCRA
jgi:hypothetical protein